MTLSILVDPDRANAAAGVIAIGKRSRPALASVCPGHVGGKNSDIEFISSEEQNRGRRHK
jgi:hypothetical protein